MTNRTYTSEAVANMIAGKLRKHQQRDFTVQKVATGYAVIDSAAPVALIQPGEGPTHVVLGEGHGKRYFFRFERQTAMWWYVKGGYIHKGSVMGTPQWSEADQIVSLIIDPKVAAKKGYDKFAIPQVADAA